MGLPTDYCVLHTAMDAVALGFETWVIRDACRAVNLNEGDEAAALRHMIAAGVQLIDSGTLQQT
jgi:nicotinamidase/pyrazinamidase